MFKPVVVILNGKKAADEAGPELHSIPCKIQHTGQANVSSYFLREKHDGGSLLDSHLSFTNWTCLSSSCILEIFR